jgi:CheY-like chemotaxis protein
MEVLEALKRDPALADVPTVGFVSHVDTATIEAARKAGVDRVLARSAFVEQLQGLLQVAPPAP